MKDTSPLPLSPDLDRWADHQRTTRQSVDPADWFGGTLDPRYDNSLAQVELQLAAEVDAAVTDDRMAALAAHLQARPDLLRLYEEECGLGLDDLLTQGGKMGAKQAVKRLLLLVLKGAKVASGALAGALVEVFLPGTAHAPTSTMDVPDEANCETFEGGGR